MENCININHPDVIKLSSELKLPPIVVAAKIGIWQEDNNNYEEFPTKEELFAHNIIDIEKLPNIPFGEVEIIDNMNNIGNYSNESDNIRFQKLIEEEKVNAINQITKEHRSITALKDLAHKLANRIGGEIEFVNRTNVDWKGYNQGMVSVLNEAYITPDTPFHEVLAHPIIRAIKQTNPELYNSLLKELETGIGKELFDRVKRDYNIKINDDIFNTKIIKIDSVYRILNNKTNLLYAPIDFKTQEDAQKYIDERIFKYSYTLEEQQEEAIVTFLGELAAGKLEYLNDTENGRSLYSKLKELWQIISDFVKQLLLADEIYIENLPIETTLDDLANIMAYGNNKIILPGYKVEYLTPLGNTYDTLEEVTNEINQLANDTVEIDLSKIETSKSYETLVEEEISLNRELLAIHNAIIKVNEDLNKIFDSRPSENLEVFFEEYDKRIRENRNPLENKRRELNEKIDNIRKKINETILGFVKQNRQYAQSRKVIEEWKKENDIQYDPEEVYSRGQEFYHIHGAYNNGVSTRLWLQNLIDTLEVKEKYLDLKIELSFATAPKGEVSKGIQAFNKESESLIYIVAYPKSEDIIMASKIDNNTSTFRMMDPFVKVFTDANNETVGVELTKSILLHNLYTIEPNLAEVVDNVAHHNEIVIGLTLYNFEIRAQKNVDYETKQLISKINALLKQKRGNKDLVKPDIKIKPYIKATPKLDALPGTDGSIHVHRQQNGDIVLGMSYHDDNFGTSFRSFPEYGNFNNFEDANVKLKEVKEEIYIKVLSEQGKQPIKTRENTTNIEDVRNRVLNSDSYIFTPEKNIAELKYEIKLLKDKIKINLMSPNNNDIYKKADNKSFEIKIKQLEEHIAKLEKDKDKQALINLQLAALKKVAKKYPRVLIISRVVPIDSDLINNNEIQYSRTEKKDINELKSKPEFKEGVEFVFNNNPELQDTIYKSLGLDKALSDITLIKDREEAIKKYEELISKEISGKPLINHLMLISSRNTGDIKNFADMIIKLSKFNPSLKKLLDNPNLYAEHDSVGDHGRYIWNYKTKYSQNYISIERAHFTQEFGNYDDVFLHELIHNLTTNAVIKESDQYNETFTKKIEILFDEFVSKQANKKIVDNDFVDKVSNIIFKLKDLLLFTQNASSLDIYNKFKTNDDYVEIKIDNILVINGKVTDADKNNIKISKITDKINTLIKQYESILEKANEGDTRFYYFLTFKDKQDQISEFLTVFMTDETFRNELKLIPYKNSTFFDKIIEFIGNLLGLTKDDTLYNEFILTLGDFISNNDYSELAKQTPKVALENELNDIKAQKQQALDIYADYVAKISLGIIKNPTTGKYNDSLSTDIWYHGTNANSENVEYLKPSQSGTYGPGIYLQSKQGHYFTGTFGKNTISVIADIKKTYDFNQDGTEFYNALRKEHGENINDKLTNILQHKLLTEDYDSLIDTVKDDINYRYLLILRPPDLLPSSKKLHILGSKTDINGVKEFIKNNFENEELTTDTKSSFSVNLNNQNQIPYIEDTTLKYRLFDGKETSNAFSVLENISFQNSPLSFLAKELLNNSKAKDLKNITIKLISRNDDIYKELSKIVSNKKYDTNYKVKSFAGIILYDENTIYITKERFDYKYETAIIHEILHALTHEKINTNVLYKNEWNDIYNYVYQTLVENNINPNDWYPMVNPDELLTGIFTNAQFMKMLSTIKSNDKSLYDYIIDFFKKLLNITNTSLLDEVMTQGLKMLNDLPIDEKYYSSNTRNFKQSYIDFNEMIEASKPNLILTEQVLDAIPDDPVIKYINGNVDDYIDLYNSQKYKPTEYPYIRYNYIIDDVKKYTPNPIDIDKRVYKSTEFNKLLNKVESINKEQGYNALKIIERIDGKYLITDNQNSNEIENIKKDLLKSLYKKDDYGLNVPWYYYAKEIIDKNVVFKHKDIYFSLDKDAFIYMLQNNIDPEYTSLIKENFANTLEIPNTNFNLLSDIVKTDNNIYLKIKNNEPVYIPNYNGLSIIKDVPMLFYKKGNNININKEGKPVLIDTKDIEIDKNGVVISDKLPIIELDINANDAILKESNKTYKDYYIDNIFKNFNISNYLTIEEAEELRNKILLKLKRDNQKYDIEFTKNKEYNKIIMTMSDDNIINISLNFNPITIKELENMDITIYDLKPEYLKSLYELTTNELNNDLTCSI